MKKLVVLHRNGSYPIYIGDGILSDPKLLHQHIHAKQVFIVTNDIVAPLYLDKIKSTLSCYQYHQTILPDGEIHKTPDTFLHIINELIEAQHHRDTTLIALGGGVTGDITGFAAASYQRGVNFIQIPTTLLSQIDSSIGGKTAVNHPQAKNMIGAFHQPQAVIIDTNTLATLPKREFVAGIAEMIKAALLRNANFFEWLETHMPALLSREPHTLTQAIYESCQIKLDIVQQDETEQGVRALLNLGHTFAHAIEKVLGYGTWLHGEAVALGLLLAADLSQALGFIDKNTVARIYNLLQKGGLPTHLPSEINCDTLLTAMGADKKVRNGKLRFILLKRIGEATIVSDIESQQIVAILQARQT